jgi:hypothetical protein
MALSQLGIWDDFRGSLLDVGSREKGVRHGANFS